MINDIRKHIMLIESIILDESFKDAQIKFSASTSSEEVKQYIDKFKELSKRNIIKGQDKDIGFWIKGDWGSFKKFVDSNSVVVTNRQTKVIQKKDSIVVYKDNNKQVVVPLTKEASIQYGKNTAWCTAYTKSHNHFIDYFYMRKITLFYVLFAYGDKYACAFHPEQADITECFDQEDKDMDFYEFKKATGISKTDIQNWYNSNKSKIEHSRDLNNVSEEVQFAAVNEDGRAIGWIDNPSEELQLAAVKQNGFTIEYIDNPSEEVQLAAVNRDGGAIKHIIDKGIDPSEEIQLAAVTRTGGAILDIIKKGIIPSEELQLAAVKENGHTIEYIIDKGIIPSEEVQLAAVNNSFMAIKCIDNPSEKLQLFAVNKNGLAIQSIDNPSEEVQLAAVNKVGSAIRDIMDKGIIPSEEVQIAAVTQNGGAIRDIIKKGIIPSEQVQLAAVKQNGFTIDYIANPTEKVKALHKKLWEQ